MGMRLAISKKQSDNKSFEIMRREMVGEILDELMHTKIYLDTIPNKFKNKHIKSIDELDEYISYFEKELDEIEEKSNQTTTDASTIDKKCLKELIFAYEKCNSSSIDLNSRSNELLKRIQSYCMSLQELIDVDLEISNLSEKIKNDDIKH